jgi:hypothetical protein
LAVEIQKPERVDRNSIFWGLDGSITHFRCLRGFVTLLPVHSSQDSFDSYARQHSRAAV